MDVPWEQIKPYVDRHRFVNQIDEQVTVYRLTDRGRKRAEWVLYRRGRAPRQACGVAIQRRTWPAGAVSRDYSLTELEEAIDDIADIADPPVHKTDHPQGLLVRFVDFPATQTALRRWIGWERHQAYGDDLQGSPVLIWLWRHVLVDYHTETPYQEVLLWHT